MEGGEEEEGGGERGKEGKEEGRKVGIEKKGEENKQK